MSNDAKHNDASPAYAGSTHYCAMQETMSASIKYGRLRPNVALVLGSGGARGLAHIGVIEELEARGYAITSIAGTSMGALIAGLYATGRLSEAREWFISLTKRKIFSLADIRITGCSIVEGDRIIASLKEIVPDVDIERLNIPTAFVAADIIHAREVVFRHGPMFDAIRASISLPLFFRPQRRGDALLIDGGLLNPLPLNRVARTEGDILVASNISGPDDLHPDNRTFIPGIASLRDLPHGDRLARLADKVSSIEARVRAGIAAQTGRKLTPDERKDLTRAVNYISMTDRISDLQIEQNTRLMLALMQPDVHAEMPQYAFPTTDYDRAREIIEAGREMMARALDHYEAGYAPQYGDRYKPVEV